MPYTLSKSDCFMPSPNPTLRFAMTIPLPVIARRLFQPTKQSFSQTKLPCTITKPYPSVRKDRFITKLAKSCYALPFETSQVRQNRLTKFQRDWGVGKLRQSNCKKLPCTITKPYPSVRKDGFITKLAKSCCALLFETSQVDLFYDPYPNKPNNSFLLKPLKNPPSV